jgi:hypothetical protein
VSHNASKKAVDAVYLYEVSLVSRISEVDIFPEDDVGETYMALESERLRLGDEGICITLATKLGGIYVIDNLE